jgi:hypothetical protein
VFFLKKILFVDLLSPKGHMKINKKFIKYLCHSSEDTVIDLVFRKDYVDYDMHKSIRDIIYLPEKYYRYNNKLEYRYKNYKLLGWIDKNVLVNNYDVIFISSYETISTAIFFKWKKINSNIFLLNHNNIQELDQSFIKKVFYRKINLNITHLVFDEKIKVYLQREIDILNKIEIINHPLVYDRDLDIRNPDKIEFIFGPSNSNNDNEISKIVGYINESDNNFDIFLKSQYMYYLEPNITVSNKWLKEDEYKLLFNKADCILLLFGDDFIHRVSGVFFEAVALNKYIITNNKYLYETYIKKYNNIGSLFQNEHELKGIISKINQGTILEENSFNDIKKHHSDEYLINQIRNIFKQN